MTQYYIALVENLFYTVIGHKTKNPGAVWTQKRDSLFYGSFHFTNEPRLLRGRKYFTQAISFDERTGGGCAAASL